MSCQVASKKRGQEKASWAEKTGNRRSEIFTASFHGKRKEGVVSLLAGPKGKKEIIVRRDSIKGKK